MRFGPSLKGEGRSKLLTPCLELSVQLLGIELVQIAQQGQSARSRKVLHTPLGGGSAVGGYRRLRSCLTNAVGHGVFLLIVREDVANAPIDNGGDVVRLDPAFADAVANGDRRLSGC